MEQAQNGGEYTRKADQEGLARSTMHLLESSEQKRTESGLTESPSGLLRQKVQENQSRSSGMVPRREEQQTSLVNRLPCPTFAKGAIESQ